jgi:hypothetical protein
MDSEIFCIKVVDEYGEYRIFEIEAANETEARIKFNNKHLDVRIVWAAQVS